jgi:hypothetical protein
MRTLKRKGPTWRPSTWEARYRGELCWVERTYAKAPRWEWTVGSDLFLEGRARTKALAMRAAERAIDESKGGKRS